MKGASEVFALLEDRQPGETDLETLEREFLEQRAIGG
jgi:hypothetical protein